MILAESRSVSRQRIDESLTRRPARLDLEGAHARNTQNLVAFKPFGVLGAAPAGVVRLVLGRVTLLLGMGVVIGTGASVWASKFVATLLYGLEPRDAGTLVSSVAVLAAVGALAGWLPAYRASNIDPAEVLRES